MGTKYERDIYLFLSLYRFFAYGLAVILIQVVALDTPSEPPARTYVLLSAVGIYTLLKVLGPLRWWREDPSTYVVLGGDALVCIVILMLTNGLDSPYLLYSFAPLLSATLLFREKMAVVGAAVLSGAMVVAHLTPRWWSTDYIWLMEGNYLLWLILYVTAAFVISTVVFRTNLNIRGRIESDAILDERRRVRREIHDGIAQSLTYLNIKIEQVGKLIAQQRATEAQTVLQEVRAISKDSYEELRDSIDQLSIEPFPLIPVLKEYVQEFEQRSGIRTWFEPPEAGFRASPAAEFQVLRIIQEALANVRRHSEATTAWVMLNGTTRTVELMIRDDGRGFVPEENSGNGSGHHGLKVMRERAESVGGTLDITSGPGKGTEVRALLPYTPAG
ncbi:MAG: sensor histidine kinase [Chloroflexi bacterium]|nr:sensor histidine kinase [Chloroflexota bacterium]